MKTADQWFDEYSLAHQNPRNQRIHLFAVPLIYWSIVVTLTTFPPLTLMLLLPAFTFYFALGWRYGFAMMLFSLICLMSGYALRVLGAPVLWLAVLVFVLAWVAQFYGHKIEGRKPSFLTDLLFLLVGPLWVLRKLF